MRQAAARALGELRSVASIECLIPLLKAGDAGQRAAVVEAFGQIGGLRVAAALASVSDGNSVGLVAALLKSDDEVVRRSALVALQKLGWQPGLDEDGATYWVMQHKWQTCIEIGAVAVPPLISALNKGDPSAACAALHRR